jgi:hypothetical protein
VARALGIVPSGRTVSVRRASDQHSPATAITWREAVRVPVFRLPPAARVLASDASGRVPLVASVRQGRGGALWVAVEPGPEGWERFPYLPQALSELGVRPPFQSRRLWAFFEPSLRPKPIQFEALAAAWRRQGLASIHVGAWQVYDGNPEMEAMLRELIEACHRHLIQVYAWLELPHVSDQFWADHPEWREKTVRLKDAHVDWRRLMNLANPQCRDAVRGGILRVMQRFDWDGINLAELYFDETAGLANLRQFTPMNDDVRREFLAAHQFDPLELFHGHADPARMRQFLDYRIDLLGRLQQQWVEELEQIRSAKPGLDLVLTQVDDQFDSKMHDALGVDAARALRLLDAHPMTFVIEDPWTLWSLGPARYAEIARRYAPLTPHQELLGVDINIVDRERPVYPTSKQTGAELLALIHTATAAFRRVAYYAEGSIRELDLPFLPAASAVVRGCDLQGGRLTIDSPYGIGVRWSGMAAVDGAVWPLQDGEVVWLPAGRHSIEDRPGAPAFAVLDFNGAIGSAQTLPDGVELSYQSDARAYASVIRRPARATVDGQDTALPQLPTTLEHVTMVLPAGAHRVRLHFE